MGRGSCVLLTGATGFIGGATAYRLLHDDRVERLVLLARANSDGEGRDRLARSISRFGPLSDRWRRVEVVRGDITSLVLERALVDSVSHVIHAAACTSLRSIKQVRHTNVIGTAAIVDQFHGAAQLRRFLFVSTAYRCGAVNARIVGEDDPAASEHVAEYSRSKSEAEESLLTRDGLPSLVVRPSIVVGHSRLGVQPSASMFWYYRALAEAGVSPFADEKRRDIVSVDYVAEALVFLAFSPSLRHRCYHVSAGECSSVRWGDLKAEFARLGVGPAQGDVIKPSALGAHPSWSSVAGDDRAFRRALEACASFSALPIEWFANERLLAEGMPPPLPFTRYLQRCVETSHLSVLEQMRDDA